MISTLFNFKDNSFSYDRMLEMAKLSASDLQMFSGLNSKDKTKMFYDISELMLDKLFILTIDIRRIETMDEYDKRQGIKPEDRKQYGYRGEIDYYLTKVIWTKEDASYFFENCWIDNSTNESERDEKIKNFQNMKIKTELLFTNRLVAYSYQTKLWANHPTYGRTMEELFNTMPDVISSQMMNELSEYSSDFKLSAVLNSAYPCNSKIGTKEGVSLTQRFYAYEKIQKSNGEYKLKRKGVLRVKMVGDNKDNNTATQLRQQGGRKLYPGMYIFENDSKYMNIILSYNNQISNDVLNLNQYNVNFNIGPWGVTKRNKLKNRYIGINIGFGNFSNVKYEKTDTIYSSGFSIPIGLEFNRELYFTRKGNIFLYPSFAMNAIIVGLFAKKENSQVDENNNGIYDVNETKADRGTPIFINSNVGLGLGLHLGPKLSLIYRSMLVYNLIAWESGPFNTVNTNDLANIWGFEYGFIKNFNNSIGLRIQF